MNEYGGYDAASSSKSNNADIPSDLRSYDSGNNTKRARSSHIENSTVRKLKASDNDSEHFAASDNYNSGIPGSPLHE